VLANLPATTGISAGDVLIVLGKPDGLRMLEQHCGHS
jgi:hypothetical protein